MIFGNKICNLSEYFLLIKFIKLYKILIVVVKLWVQTLMFFEFLFLQLLLQIILIQDDMKKFFNLKIFFFVLDIIILSCVFIDFTINTKKILIQIQE